MNSTPSRLVWGWTAAILLAAVPLFVGCGGTSGSAMAPGPQNGTVSMMMSDDQAQDWATVGITISSITFTSQNGGAVAVYTVPNPAPVINLVQLDQLDELLGNFSVPAGTYTSATFTMSANPQDVLLTSSADPSASFVGTASTTVSSNQVQVQGATGNAGSQTVSVNINFVSPLVVAANQTSPLEIEFDLSHPAFLVAHAVSGGGTTLWGVNFKGPLRHRPIADIARLVLRHLYGTVTGISSDNASISVTKDYPVYPPTNPETEITSSQSLSILADATNGTIFYDVDAGTSTTIMNFSSFTSNNPLIGKFVRIAARFQEDHTLVAVRIWASSTFNKVWVSPEGHVLHIGAVNNITDTAVIHVENELGFGVPITVNSGTEFFYRTPANALADTKPIGSGVGFLIAKNLVRGFKVHVSVVDPLASPLVAQAIDIETARYDGYISNPGNTSFTDTRVFPTVTDSYTVILPYISSGTPNPLATDPNAGFKWWNFAFPTIVNSGANAIGAFISATNGMSVNFGGTVGALPVWGTSNTTWNDTAAPTSWAAKYTILQPTPAPLGSVFGAWVGGAGGGSFTMKVPGGANAVTINVSDVSGSATLVYQVSRTGNTLTITPIDITTQNGLDTLASNLGTVGTPVKVYGIPQATGGLQTYVLFYYAGNVMPAS